MSARSGGGNAWKWPCSLRSSTLRRYQIYRARPGSIGGGKDLNICFSACVDEPLNQSVQPGSFVSKRTRISSSRSPRSLLNGGCCAWQSLVVRRKPWYFQAIPFLWIPINVMVFFINWGNSRQFLLILNDSWEYWGTLKSPNNFLDTSVLVSFHV